MWGRGAGRQREARALQTKPGVTKKTNRMFGRRYSAAFIAIQPLAEYLKNEPSRTALKYNHKEGTFQIFFIFFGGGPGKQRGWSTPQHNKIYYWDPYISVVYMEFVAALSSDHLHVFSILFYFFYFIFFMFFYFCFFFAWHTARLVHPSTYRSLIWRAFLSDLVAACFFLF